MLPGPEKAAEQKQYLGAGERHPEAAAQARAAEIAAQVAVHIVEKLEQHGRRLGRRGWWRCGTSRRGPASRVGQLVGQTAATLGVDCAAGLQF